MTTDGELDLFSWSGVTACIAVGLFALWVGIDSAVQVFQGTLLTKDALLDLLAIPIGLGFLVAALDIVRPADHSRLAAVAGVAFWPMFALYIIAGILSQPLHSPNWQRLGISVLVWTVLVLLFIGWRRLTEPQA